MEEQRRVELIADLLRRQGPTWSKAISRALDIPWEDVVDTLAGHRDRFHPVGHTWGEPLNQACWALLEGRVPGPGRLHVRTGARRGDSGRRKGE